MNPKNIVRAGVFPTIGVARIGNSMAEGPQDYFIGPEVPNAPVLKAGEHKDKSGALKRQAARFRIFGYNGRRDGV